MNAQHLLTLSALAKTAYRLVANLEFITTELSIFEDESNPTGDDADALAEATDEMRVAHDRAETAAERIASIVNAGDGDNDFFFSLSDDDRLFLYGYWDALSYSDYPFFSPEWTEWLHKGVRNDADRIRVLDIRQRGLDWFEAHLHNMASAK